MMYCPNCGQRIADNSKFCQFCGEKIGQYQSVDETSNSKKQHTKSKKTWILLAVALVIGIVVLSVSMQIVKSIQQEVEEYNTEYRQSHSTNTPSSSSTPRPSSSSTGNSTGNSSLANFTNSEAFTVALEVVRQNLKSPSTAKFCKYTEASCTYNASTNYWTVTGWVDAQNSFGATIRQNFTAKFQPVRKGEQIGCEHGTCTFN